MKTIAAPLLIADVVVGSELLTLPLLTDKKKWLSDERFLEMLSIASALPGPSSTQVVTSMGLLHAGPLGGLTAFFFWVLPGFTIMTLAGIGAKTYLHDGLPGWMAGFAPAAVSLVVVAAVRLWQKAVGEDMAKGFVAALSSCVILATQGLSSAIFPLVLLTGGLVILLLNATGHTRTAISTEKSSSSHLERCGRLVHLLWAVAERVD